MIQYVRVSSAIPPQRFQNLADSEFDVNTTSLSDKNAMLITNLPLFSIVCCLIPDATSQIWNSYRDVVTIASPWGENSNDLTVSPWSKIAFGRVWCMTFHTRTIPSVDATASRRPSGEKIIRLGNP